MSDQGKPSIWRSPLPVSGKALVLAIVLSIAGLGAQAIQGAQIPWPNPFTVSGELRPSLLPQGATLEVSAEEELVDEELAPLEESLAELPAFDESHLSGPSSVTSGALSRDNGPAQALPYSKEAPVLSEAPLAAGSEQTVAPSESEKGQVEAPAGIESPVAAPQAQPVAKSDEPVATPLTPVPAELPAEDLKAGSAPGIEDPCLEKEGERCRRSAMSGFYRALATMGETDKVRILIYGDSQIMGDRLVSTLRNKFQSTFGNGGPGFILPVSSYKGYRVAGTVSYGSQRWKIHRATTPRIADGLYGLAGQTFLVSGGGHKAQIRCSDSCPWTQVSQYELFYLGGPAGGTARVIVGEDSPVETSLKADTQGSGYQRFETTPGPLAFRYETVSGTHRLFGVAAENAGSGIVVDSVAIVGARSYRLNNILPEHFGEQLAHRKPNLIILMFGANESEVEHVSRTAYHDELVKLVRTLRSGNEGTSVLMLSPPARGIRQGGKLEMRPVIDELVEVQRLVCQEEGIAFWDERTAMGGKQGPARWHNHKPRLLGSDLTHFTNAGATLMGKMLYGTLLRGYVAFRKDMASSMTREVSK